MNDPPATDDSIARFRLDERELRDALGTFATGVAIVTTTPSDGRPRGMTVNSFAAVSLSPPLVLWNVADNSPSSAAFRDATHFAVNVLALEQLEYSRQFSRATPDKFAHVPFSLSPTGCPILAGAVAHFECAREHVYTGGDHAIIVGRVLRFTHASAPTLVFCQGRYQRTVALEPGADAQAELSVAWSGLA